MDELQQRIDASEQRWLEVTAQLEDRDASQKALEALLASPANGTACPCDGDCESLHCESGAIADTVTQHDNQICPFVFGV
ncbi:MAG: hypothetical protein N838_25875 [Thiohalocapsa sp. PB-PSB1]|nr:MAG: hypothetical protein N838_23810 [Thiohalocapsa sp. PB-PSB1]QQO56284.1 MAG: hypothetical protein N838_25875 [Thiohalocapsa sp. PB-PSB1]